MELRPIFLVCLALISVSQADDFRMRLCSERLILSEYGREHNQVRGFYEHYTASSPYYFGSFGESMTDVPVTRFGISTGKDYLSRNQIPTSDDYRRINPTAFATTDMIRLDYNSANLAGGPILTNIDFGDKSIRYVSAYAIIPDVGSRQSLNWARQHEWQTENACEFFAGSYFEVKCEPLWNFTKGATTLIDNQFAVGFGSGNPLTGIKTHSGQSATWVSDLQQTNIIEINLYYNLGVNDKLKIYDGKDSTTAPRLANIVGPAVGTMTVKTTATDFSASYDTSSDEGRGFRAVYNPAGAWPCFSTGGANQCDNSCYKSYICEWDGVSMSASLLSGFDYTSCCSSKWGPECVLAAESIYYLQACDDAPLNTPYANDNGARDVKRAEFVEENMPHIDSVSDLHHQRVMFTAGPKSTQSA